MGYWEESTVEVTYNGRTTRVAKSDAHLYQDKAKKVKEEKPKKDANSK